MGSRLRTSTIRTRHAIAVLFVTAACLMTTPSASAADDEVTPLAGQEYRTKLLGQNIEVPPRDSRHVVAANFGLMWIPNGPSFYEILPFGSLYIWHNWEEEQKRLRATISVAFNDV